MGNTYNPAFYTSYQQPSVQNQYQQYLASLNSYSPPQGTQMVIQGSPAQPGAGAGLGNLAGQGAGIYASNSLMGGGAAIPSAAPVVAGPSAMVPTASPMLPGTAVGGAPGAFSLAGIGSAGNVYLPALGAIGAVNLIKHQGDAPRGGYVRGIGQGAASGAAMGSYFGPVGAIVGGAAGGLLGGIGAATGSGKDKYQMDRDKLRAALQGRGIADSKFMVNGLDVGRDGGAMLDNLGANIDGNKKRHYYDVDFSNPLSGGTVSAVNPLTMALLGQGAKQKQIDDLNGMLTNAVMAGATDQAAINKNLTALYQKAGITPGKFPTGPVAALNAPGIKLATPATPARSKTSSPGISKDGKRISYQGGKK